MSQLSASMASPIAIVFDKCRLMPWFDVNLKAPNAIMGGIKK